MMSIIFVPSGKVYVVVWTGMTGRPSPMLLRLVSGKDSMVRSLFSMITGGEKVYVRLMVCASSGIMSVGLISVVSCLKKSVE